RSMSSSLTICPLKKSTKPSIYYMKGKAFAPCCITNYFLQRRHFRQPAMRAEVIRIITGIFYVYFNYRDCREQKFWWLAQTLYAFFQHLEVRNGLRHLFTTPSGNQKSSGALVAVRLDLHRGKFYAKSRSEERRVGKE